MSASDEQLSLHWQYYADKSGELNRGAADDYGQGREEQLHETLAFIGTGNRFTTEQRDYLNRIPQNRAKKHRRLRLHNFGHAILDYYDDPNSELLNLVHQTLTPREWAIECRLAEGESYAAVASDIGTSVTAMKMRVSGDKFPHFIGVDRYLATNSSNRIGGNGDVLIIDHSHFVSLKMALLKTTGN